MLNERIKCKSLMDKIITAEQAAEMIKPGMTLCCSGFTAVGYPKAIPRAIAKAGMANDLKILGAASAGDELDGELARAGLMGLRSTFNVVKAARDGINDGSIRYMDLHLSHLPQRLRDKIWGEPDFAILECCMILEDGSIVPTLSTGTPDAMIESSKQVLLELNVSHSTLLYGMHDCYSIGRLPSHAPLEIKHVTDRIGGAAFPCDPNKIAGIVVTNLHDQQPRFLPPDETSQRIAGHILDFLKSEMRKGRIEKGFTIQSGFGAVANAVMYGLDSDDFGKLNMYTEVAQDGALELILSGRIEKVSCTSLSLSLEGRERLYANIANLRERVVIRTQDISNAPEVIRRLGVIAMNTVIEADIYGNANSTHIMGSAMMNGLGGSGDFSRNGLLSIFMTPSLAKNGAISCIVPMVSHVDHTEHDTQIFVTEQGLADLRGLCPRDRAELMIEKCAHPSYRPMLREYYENAKRSSKAQHTPHDLTKALSWHQRYLETGTMQMS